MKIIYIKLLKQSVEKYRKQNKKKLSFYGKSVYSEKRNKQAFLIFLQKTDKNNWRKKSCLDLCREECKIMKKRGNIMRNLVIFTQFGFSFITPLLLCVCLCWWLTERFAVGSWIFIPGFFFGLGGSGMVAWQYYLAVMNQDRKERNSGQEEVHEQKESHWQENEQKLENEQER